MTSTRQISFAILGMPNANPKSAADIERVLSQLDGVVAAHVNYATERAMLVYNPARSTVLRIVRAIRDLGYDTPVEHETVHADELIYATSGQTVENILRRVDGVVGVSANLTGRFVTLEIFPKYRHDTILEHVRARLGLARDEAGSVDARMLFLLRSAILVLVEAITLWSAGAHAGMFASPSSLHAPLVVVVISLVAFLGAGLPFYRFVYDAALQGQFDLGIVLALLASGLAAASLPLGILWPSRWLTDAGFVAATTLTTGWFIARAVTLWVLPRFGRAVNRTCLMMEAQNRLGVISNDRGTFRR